MEHAIVLTGGIASGKSTASAILQLLGFRVVDADKIAHEVLNASADEIAKAFGKEFITQNGVDRKKLGTLVFADAKERQKLESIVHPKIKEEIFTRAKEQEKFKKPYLIDLPLFFERQESYSDFKKVLVVYAPQEIQLLRLIKRDGFSKKEALQRLNAQLPIEYKKEKANYLIDNSKDLAHLQKECEKVKEEILKDF